MTRIEGREREGPAKEKSERAGPWPIPEPRSPWTMGISVRVAKYMRAPAKDAIKFERSEFPPRSPAIHALGMRASCPGLPRRKPDTRTPAKRRGSIWREKSLVATTQVFLSSAENQRIRV
jgi:hypothetical protein